ncbi:asparagine synthase-related protein [Clostridium sp. C8-1-8]|uniref:asparagine synthase-related protein n=1 Tax=Clostridium sp. C8-1-8 TaxID=2698831 RepID=UPI001371782E|nr:asparagine synthase-related protein [Clostridium sp. C8-1-8]
MSAIWGFVNTDYLRSDEELGKSMNKCFEKYKIDSIEYISSNNVFMGCGLQRVTKESLDEVLPNKYKDGDLIITADAIIDNREELFKLLNLDKDKFQGISDSELIIKAYSKWGKNCPKYLIGDFAFAIWNEVTKELFCARDHVGKRTFYYSYVKKRFSFSTIIKPLLKLMNNKIEFNERWITDYLALDGLLHEFEPTDTVYKDVYQILPGHSITVTNDKLEIEQYWNPLRDIKPAKFKSDEECIEQFKKIFFEAVSCRLRTTGEVGMMLSGGLDSGSVACVAARELEKDKKVIHAFSSIPMVGFDKENTKRLTVNESEYIESEVNKYKNIEVNYCRSEGKDSLTDIDEIIDILEQPYKIVQNIFWYKEIIKKAAENGCSIILNGQFGNSTISNGEFMTHFKTLIEQGKLLTLAKEIKLLSRDINVPRRNIVKVVAKAAIPFSIRNFIAKKSKDNDRFSSVSVNPELIRKWDVESRFDQKGFNLLTDKFLDIEAYRKSLVDPLPMNHIATVETKITLYYGLVLRDPTRDKRLIEFCLSLPSDQFVRNGEDRILIRRAMKDILPDKVRLNKTAYGLQSADWLNRLKPKWNEVLKEFKRIAEDESLKTYLDIDKINKEVSKIEDSFDEEKSDTILMLLISLVFAKFVKSKSYAQVD